MTMRRIYYYQDSSCDQVDTKIPESFLTSHRPYITNHFYQQLFFYQPSTSLEESVRTHCKSTEAFQYTDIFSCLQLNQAIVSRGDSSTNYDQAGIKRGSSGEAPLIGKLIGEHFRVKPIGIGMFQHSAQAFPSRLFLWGEIS